MNSKRYEYDIALSFAGENRAYVERVANSLQVRGILVFYDLFEEANLWGKNLYDYLTEIYQNKARYTVIFISSFYNKKLWTNLERASMQARAFQESREYILPARFDDTEIPGILQTVGYISLKNRTPEEFAKIIEKKLGKDTTVSKNRWSKLSNLVNNKPSIFTIKLENREQAPVKNAKVWLVANNSIYLEGRSDENGLAHFVIRTRKNYKMLISHLEYESVFFEDISTKEDIRIMMSNLETEKRGSIIINTSGEIPGICGRIKLINIAGNTIGLQGDNIAIDGGKDQPFGIRIGTEIVLEDSMGGVVNLYIRFLQKKIVLIDFSI